MDLSGSAFPTSKNSANRRWFLYGAVCIANLATLACGISFGWTSPELAKLRKLEENQINHILTENEEGWIGSLLPLGAAVCPLIAGPLMDKIGRKRTLLIGNIPFIFAMLLNVVATNVYYLFISRFLCGCTVGMTYAVLPIYVAEIAEDDVRSSLGGLILSFCNIGMLFSYSIGPFVSTKLFNIICIIPGVAFLILFFIFVPESPYYLIAKQDLVSADQALMKFRHKSKYQIQKELEVLKLTIDQASANKASVTDVFKSRGVAKALLLCNGVLIFQQLTGINVVLFYSENIFKDAGVSVSPAICTIIIGIVQTLTSIASSAVMEKFGKRILLLFSSMGTSLSLASLAYFFYQKDTRQADISNISWLPLVSLVFYIITFCIGFGPISWVILGELFPANLKSVATTISSVTNWFAAFVVTRYFTEIVNLIGQSGSFGLFAICCCVAGIFIYFCLPETTGKSLQDIQDILNGKHRK